MDNIVTYDFHKYLGYLIILGAPLPFLKNDRPPDQFAHLIKNLALLGNQC